MASKSSTPSGGQATPAAEAPQRGPNGEHDWYVVGPFRQCRHCGMQRTASGTRWRGAALVTWTRVGAAPIPPCSGSGAPAQARHNGERGHRWGNPTASGVRTCNRPGCRVQVRNSFREWRPNVHARWRWQHRVLIPPCAGAPVQEEPAPVDVVLRCSACGALGGGSLLGRPHASCVDGGRWVTEADHRWGKPDDDGVRHCLNDDCRVSIQRDEDGIGWHAGHGWVALSESTPIPPCRPPAPERMTDEEGGRIVGILLSACEFGPSSPGHAAARREELVRFANAFAIIRRVEKEQAERLKALERSASRDREALRNSLLRISEELALHGFYPASHTSLVDILNCINAMGEALRKARKVS